MSTLMLAEIATLLGDPSRARMLTALLAGRALTAKELASIAGVAPQTGSGHLAKLVSSNLLKQDKQGRHRYFRLASPDVARMLESLLNVAVATIPARHRPSSKADERLRLARTCYDHLAGWVGVSIAEALVDRGFVILGDEVGEVTAAGFQFFADFGVTTTSAGPARRCHCRPCLDWTERKHHLAGFIGASLMNRLLELDWIARVRGCRAITITPAGREGLGRQWGIDVNAAMGAIKPAR